MKAEIIAVGTEILLGDILNTNAQYLSKELAQLGIEVYFQTVVGDNPKRLKDTIFQAFSRADLIITTGGLGPTEDDLTKMCIRDRITAVAKTASGPSEETDEFFEQAVDLILEKEKASVSMLQRQFRIGYNRAARLMDELERRGLVGPEEGSKPRKVLITREQWEEMQSPTEENA